MWWAAFAVFLSGVPWLAASAPASSADDLRVNYDVIIVGGGPGGLSALSALARVRRNVLLVDSGDYRNAKTRHMHDVLGFDGVRPEYYRWAAREQIRHYSTVSMTNGSVTKIERVEGVDLFCVYGEFNGREDAFTARRIVLATGVRDLVPDTPGVKEGWGKGIYWCPWCDGHEHLGQTLGLMSTLNKISGMVNEISTINKDLVALVNGTDTPEMRAEASKIMPEWEKYLSLHNVKIENRSIAKVERLSLTEHEIDDRNVPSAPAQDLFRVHFAYGPPLERQALMTSFGHQQASNLGRDMGVKLYGEHLAVDQDKGLMTNIPGVYAVGDANSDNVTNVPHALYSGKRTAVYLHVELEREFAALEVKDINPIKTVRRSVHDEAREVWDVMNGPAGDLLHAGDFDGSQMSGRK